jgi:P pilus assembly chaperone PapD
MLKLNSKIKILSTLLIALMFTKDVYAQVVSLKLDKLFYFYDNTQPVGEVKVSNESDFLTAVRFKVYDQKKTLSESIGFDFEKDSEDIDVFPNEFILSPKRKQNVSLNITPIGNDDTERIFRVRAIPVPLDKMLSDNIELKKLLSEEQKLKYSQEGNTTAKLNVGIGYGALVVTQPFTEIRPNLLDISFDKSGAKVNNRSKYVVEISNLIINGRFMDNLIVKGLSSKELKLNERVNSLTGILQNGVRINCNQSGECNEI